MLTLTKCQGALAIPSTGATVTVSNLKHLVKQIVCIPRFKTEHQQDDLPLSGGMCIRRPAVASASRRRPPRAAAASWGRQVARPAHLACGRRGQPRWRGRRSPHQRRCGAVWPGAGARRAPVAWAAQPAPAPAWRSVARSRRHAERRRGDWPERARGGGSPQVLRGGQAVWRGLWPAAGAFASWG